MNSTVDWANERLARNGRERQSAYDFNDEFNVDPVRMRYGTTIMDARRTTSLKEMELDLRNQQANIFGQQLRNASLLAEEGYKLRQRMETDAQLTDAYEALGEAKTPEQMQQLRENFSLAFRDEVFSNNFTSKEQNIGKNELLRAKAAEAGKLLEFDSALSSGQSASNAALNLVSAAASEENQAIQSLKSSLPTAMSAAEVDSLAAGTSKFAGNKEREELLGIYRPLASRTEAAIKGLLDRGVNVLPVKNGKFDLDEAETLIRNTEDPDIRQYNTAISVLSKQLETFDDARDPEAVKIQDKINTLASELTTALTRKRPERDAAVAKLDTMRTLTPEQEQEAIEFGGLYAGKSPKAAVAPTAAGASVPAPASVTTPDAAPPAAPTAEPPKGDKPEKRSPEPLNVTQADLDAAQQEYTVAAATPQRPGTPALKDQPWGVRQILEAVDSGYREPREKKAAVEKLKKQLYPFESFNPRDPHDVQKAISIVYPDVSGGKGLRRFGVGDSNDARVIFAAEFLRSVDPKFLRRMAQSPGEGGGRVNLTFEELPALAEMASSVRSGTTK